MIHFITWLAWVCLLTAVVGSLMGVLASLAMHLVIIGLVLLFGAALNARS